MPSPCPVRARLACHPAVICRDWSSLAAVAAGVGWGAGGRLQSWELTPVWSSPGSLLGLECVMDRGQGRR